MEKQSNNKKNIWLYFVKMVFVFLILFFAQQIGTSILYSSFTYLKYGPEIITQSIWAVLVIIILMLFKNSYVFTETKEDIFKSMKLGWPIIILGTFFLGLNVITVGQSLEIPVALNLATFCLLIGIVEEFLCRGWLLNEFLERFSDNKKSIILSIVLSSLIFGAIHIFNISAGQSLIDTIVQVINATLLGVIFAMMYYKSKNIWSVVLLHAFWDFALMLGDAPALVDCYTTTATTSIIIYNLISSVAIIIALGIICYCMATKIGILDVNKKVPQKLYKAMPIIAIIIYLVALFITPKDIENYYVCPEYKKEKIASEYEVQYYAREKYNLLYEKQNTQPVIESIPQDGTVVENQNEKFNFELSINGKTGEIEFENTTIKKKVELTENGAIDYLLIDNNDSYIIFIQNDINKVLYGKYSKVELENTEEYLEIVKNGLIEYTVPQINLIGTVKLGDSEYKHAQIQTVIYDKLLFTEDDELIVAVAE